MGTKKKKPEVLFIPWDAKDRLGELIDRSNLKKTFKNGDFVAIKMHFGERGGDGHIKPEFVRPVIKAVRSAKAKPFLTDTNTIYHGPRNNAVGHLEVAAEHGFSQTRLHTPIIISDGLRGDDYEEVEVDCSHFKSVKIATGIHRANAMIALSHFKGHLLTGFGGAIKNIGMGCGARIGKFEMHTKASPTVEVSNCIACGACLDKCAQGALSIVHDKIKLDESLCVGCGECVVACPTNTLQITWSMETKRVQEKMAEYALGAVKNKKVCYINFLNHITPNCDCMGMKEKPLLPDIGILASDDPVAIDQACLDLVIKKGGDVFRKAHTNIDGTIQLEHAEKIGLGSRTYELIEI